MNTQNARYVESWYEPDVIDFDDVIKKRPGYRIFKMFMVYKGKKEAYRIIFEKEPDTIEKR